MPASSPSPLLPGPSSGAGVRAGRAEGDPEELSMLHRIADAARRAGG